MSGTDQVQDTRHGLLYRGLTALHPLDRLVGVDNGIDDAHGRTADLALRVREGVLGEVVSGEQVLPPRLPVSTLPCTQRTARPPALDSPPWKRPPCTTGTRSPREPGWS